jgi:hypothetical protein
MLTGMTEDDWSIVVEVFEAAQSRRGEPGHDGNRGKTPGTMRQAGCPRQRMRSGRCGTVGPPKTPSLSPR